jgi:hypothetical protein
VTFQKALVLVARELRASIRVQNDRRSIRPLPQRHQHGLQDKLTILTATHRPADDDVGVQIEDDAKIQPVLGRPDERDVGRHLVLGSTALKSRAKWFVMSSGRRPDALLFHCFFCGMPLRPAWLMSRATRFSLQNSPV